MSPRVSVLIVAYESAPVLPRCLAALRAQTFRDFEVILADNGSVDGGARAAAAAHPDVTLLALGANLGFAAGNNRAAELARGDWLALLNPDAFPEPAWLERLVAAAEAHPEVEAFTSLQLAADDEAVLDGAGDAMTLAGLPYRMGYRRPAPPRVAAGEVFAACGAAMMIRRDTFQALGGFDPRWFCYCEDMDLSWRLRLAGGRVRLAPDAIVRHVGSSTLGARSGFAIFHGVRNRMWTFARNMPGPLMPLALPLHAAATAGLMLGHLLRGEARPAWRGLGAGLRGLPAILRERPRTWPRWREVARALTWSPLKAARRGLDVRR